MAHTRFWYTVALATLIGTAHAGDQTGETREDVPVEMAPVIIESSFSEVKFRARFRYNIPGKALKHLTVTKASKAWRDQGLAEGMRVTGIDGSKIDGRSLVEVVKQIEAKEGQPISVDVVNPKTESTATVQVLFKKDSGNLVIHYP